MKRTLQFTAVFVLGALVSFPAFALPRFASRTGAKCLSCHINPSGGGMRQTFGVQYGRETLPVPTWSDELGLDDFSTKLSDFVSIGADFRSLFFYLQGSPSSQNAFYQMQGTLYSNFKVAKKFNMYLAKGLYSGFEIFGMLAVLPSNGFIKVGKFIPNYGLKMDDHRVFTREKTGFSPEIGRPELTGGEVAVLPGPMTFTGGIYNSEEAGDRPTGNKHKAILGRAEGMFRLSEDATVCVGGNVFAKKSIQGMKTTLAGGFASLSYRSVTILGEADLIRNTGAGTTKDSTSVVTYLEADYVVTPGLDLKFIYDFYDADKDLKSGATSRYSFGFEFFPISGVEVRPLYRISKEEPIDAQNNEFDLVIHFYI